MASNARPTTAHLGVGYAQVCYGADGHPTAYLLPLTGGRGRGRGAVDVAQVARIQVSGINPDGTARCWMVGLPGIGFAEPFDFPTAMQAAAAVADPLIREKITEVTMEVREAVQLEQRARDLRTSTDEGVAAILAWQPAPAPAGRRTVTT